MTYDFHPEAERELEDAVAYYDNIKRELVIAFMHLQRKPNYWTNRV